MTRSESDSAYFERRASEEAAAAERAGDERARQLHIELADRYSNAARSVGPDLEEGGSDTVARAGRPVAGEFRILN